MSGDFEVEKGVMVPKTVGDMSEDEKTGGSGPIEPLMKALMKALLTDREYLLGWHCNLAMTADDAIDALGVPILGTKQRWLVSQEVARRFIGVLFASEGASPEPITNAEVRGGLGSPSEGKEEDAEGLGWPRCEHPEANARVCKFTNRLQNRCSVHDDAALIPKPAEAAESTSEAEAGGEGDGDGDDYIDESPCNNCGEPWCDICAFRREQAVAANPCPTCKGLGLKPTESTNPTELITRVRALVLELADALEEMATSVKELEAAAKLRPMSEAPKYNGPILAVTRIRWVDEHDMWSAVGCEGEFVHDDVDGWLPDRGREGKSDA